MAPSSPGCRLTTTLSKLRCGAIVEIKLHKHPYEHTIEEGQEMSSKNQYPFVGGEYANIRRQSEKESAIPTLGDLYSALTTCWCRETAYPADQRDWSETIPSWGQCAITAMLVHRMFGGEIYRIRFPEGGTHYFNHINNHIIDLTSEQFGDDPADYTTGSKIDASYCGKNTNTQARYKLLVERITAHLKASNVS